MEPVAISLQSQAAMVKTVLKKKLVDHTQEAYRSHDFVNMHVAPAGCKPGDKTLTMTKTCCNFTSVTSCGGENFLEEESCRSYARSL